MPAPAVLIALYLNRCPDGCTITAGPDDARADTSSVAAGTLTAMPRLDLVWADIVICVRDLVAPYDVQVVTEEPVDGEYVEVMIAGLPGEVGAADGALAVAPHSCELQPYGLAIAFSNGYDLVAEPDHAADLCWTVGQQAGFLWGLRRVGSTHDVMGPREAGVRPWFTRAPLLADDECTWKQNAHAILVERLGAGADFGPPLVEVDGRSFTVTSPRTITRVVAGRELPVRDGAYPIDGVGELELRAFDDLGRMGGADVYLEDDDGGCSTAGTDGAVLALLALLSLPRRRRA